MKVVKTNNLKLQFNQQKKPLIAIWGFFDGWHLGHQALLRKMQMIAADRGYQTLVISFNIKPQSVLLHKSFAILMSEDDKQAFLVAQNIDYYCQLIFDDHLAHQSAQTFIAWLITNQVQAVVCAPDVHFGVKGEGSLQTLQNSPLQVYLSTEVLDYNQHKVSSSYIKSLLIAKQIDHANSLLQNSFLSTASVTGYTIKGIVVGGLKEGRTLGFRTANLKLSSNYLIPGLGVYISLTQVKHQWHHSLTVVSLRNNQVLVESYILNFKQQIYGQAISVKFLHYLRDNIVFASKEALIAQIKADEQAAITYFQQLKIKDVN